MVKTEKEKTCTDRIAGKLAGRLQDLRLLLDRYESGEAGGDLDSDGDEIGDLLDYGLCFDYVEKNTFKGQRRGYWRYQLSWGGPSDEFRFFVDSDGSVDQIYYHFMEWFDGAKRRLRGEDFKALERVYQIHRGEE